jgi:hypothetical protein
MPGTLASVAGSSSLVDDDAALPAAELGQQFSQLERRTLARIIDILLVCHSQQTNATALDWFAVVVEKFAQAINHIARHASIDFTSQLDKSSTHAMTTRQPAQIEWVDRNAMPA